MTFLPGTPLPSLPPGADTIRVRRERGAAIARLHRVSGDRFGYPGDRPSAANWPDAYAAGEPDRWALLGRLVSDLVDRLTAAGGDPGQ